jgi:hypothetical protein
MLLEINENKRNSFLYLMDIYLFDTNGQLSTILLHKLKFYGVDGTTLAWISSFLSSRKQLVLLDGVKSSEKEVLSGVPQGTVPRPLLFLSFINDLPDVTTSSDARLFADDCLLYRHINSQNYCCKKKRPFTT